MGRRERTIRRVVLVLCGALLSGSVLRWAATGDQTGRIASHLALYGLAFFAYLAALWGSRDLGPRALGAALVLALAWRAVLVPVPPLVSDDVNRYVWEGRIQLHGGNPYAWADRPEADKWASLRDPVWRGVNHKGYSTLYPAAWELAVRAVVAVHDSVTAMKTFLVACELVTLLALMAGLRRRGLPRERILIFAWSPLAIVEIAGSGHNDPLGLLFLSLALLALDAGRPLWSAVAAALGFQAKLLPGLVAVAWARRYRLRHVLAAALVAGLVTVPYLSAGKDLLLGLRSYARYWRFNETAFALLAAVLPQGWAPTAAGLMGVAFAAALAVRRTEPATAGLAVAAASLLLAANVLPWYALWLLPFLVLADAPAALLFTGTVEFAYLVYPGWQSGERWHLGWGLRALEYGPVLLVALAHWRRRPWRRTTAA